MDAYRLHTTLRQFQNLLPTNPIGYGQCVWFALGTPNAPSTAPNTVSSAPTPQVPQGSTPQQQVALTREELDDVLSSPELERKYSPKALLEELLGHSPLPRMEALHSLQETLERHHIYGIGDDMVTRIAEKYQTLNISPDEPAATNFLYDISLALGFAPTSGLQRAHPKVVETIAKGVLLASLDVSLIGGQLGELPITLTELRDANTGIGVTSLTIHRLVKELEHEQTQEWLRMYGVGTYLVPYEQDLRKNFQGTVDALLRGRYGALPQEVIDALQEEPKIPFKELARTLEKADLPFLNKVKKKKVREIVKHVTEDYRQVMDDAIRKELRAGTPVVSPEQIQETCGIMPGSVVSFLTEQGKVLVEVTDLTSQFERTGSPPVREDARVHLTMGNGQDVLSGPDFLNLWKHSHGHVEITEPMSRDDFFEQYSITDEDRSASPLYMVADGDIYPLRSMNDQRLRMGGKNISWGALQAFLMTKGYKEDKISFKAELDDKDTEHVVKKGGGPKKSFWNAWTSVFASPKQVVSMAKSVIEYFKEDWEAGQKTKGYELLHNMLPEGIFKDEIEAKLAGMQDDQMQSKLKVIKSRTSGQVAKSAFQVFTQARNGGNVPDSILKAYLLAVLDKGGDLYYGNGGLYPHKNTFFIYEALGGQKGDEAYQRILKQEREVDPSLKAPSEWRVIQEYLEINKKRFGPTFFDTFDSTYNAAKGPQMEKHEKTLSDVNSKRQLINFNISEAYGGRLWRCFQGFKTIVAREQGVMAAFEVYFHLLSFGNVLEEKQRKEFKNFGASGHMPFLYNYVSPAATTMAQKAMGDAITALAQSPKYRNSSVVKAGGKTYDLKDKGSFDYIKLFTPGSKIGHRAILEKVFTLMGPDLYKYVSGTGSYKVFTKPQFRPYVKSMQEVLEGYELGNHDPTVFEYYTSFFSNPEKAGGSGIINKILTTNQLSGSFRIGGSNEEKAITYMNNLMNELEGMYTILQSNAPTDPLTGESYSPQEVQRLQAHFDGIKKQLIEYFAKRMDSGTYGLFLQSPLGYAQRMKAMKFPLPDTYEELHGMPPATPKSAKSDNGFLRSATPQPPRQQQQRIA